MYRHVKWTFNVFPTCVWRLSTVLTKCVAIVSDAYSMCLVCFLAPVTSRGHYKSIPPFLQYIGNKITNAISMHVLQSIMAYFLCGWPGTHVSTLIGPINDKHTLYMSKRYYLMISSYDYSCSRTSFTIWTYWWIISYDNITGLYSNV